MFLKCTPALHNDIISTLPLNNFIINKSAFLERTTVNILYNFGSKNKIKY